MTSVPELIRKLKEMKKDFLFVANRTTQSPAAREDARQKAKTIGEAIRCIGALKFGRVK